MRRSYLHIEEVDEGESKRKIKTTNKIENIKTVEWSLCYLTSSGSASAAMTTNSEIPRFKVLVASLAPDYDFIFGHKQLISSVQIFSKSNFNKLNFYIDDNAWTKIKSFLCVIACNW